MKIVVEKKRTLRIINAEDQFSADTVSEMKGQVAMNITDVRVRKVAKEGKMKAVVSVTIDDEFVVHDIKVIEGEKGAVHRNAKP